MSTRLRFLPALSMVLSACAQAPSPHLDGSKGLLTEWYGPMLVRFRYFALQPDKFLWRADATFDRGKTWITDYWTMEAHRISR